ncbi:SHOCT domain-containing protein [uncultured Amnibacterium sp.]|uniref:SHOCT domain-containing protein n=1 Tax=uncultured Amnibacterium sp. TaxID=1631851 RepID=UPI0035CB6A43
MVSVHRHVAILSSMLEADESQQVWVAATLSGRDHRGALMVTDRRVLFTGLGMFTQTQESFPMAMLTEVRVALPAGAARRIAGELHVGVLGDEWVFAGLPADVQRVAAAIDAGRARLGLRSDAAAATPSASVLDRLERLEQLRTTGAISDTEFTAAKRRLLD